MPGPRWQGTMLAVMEGRYFKRFCFRLTRRASVTPQPPTHPSSSVPIEPGRIPDLGGEKFKNS